ncbi:LAQU0S18e00980g1_1 [Lachancea quebecensis]|uniref:LAQU0S18e00980g1_1 n=1 Tax=Lachancea quebecensis TaxID=1654605 RepID=A0A0P1KYV8_9SACH|nr:LAQU0S18e00980g1_1 [Lachancea quebecensis]
MLGALAFAWLLQVLGVANGAGVGVHLTLLARTIVPEDFNSFSSVMKAGVFFPDALYSCNSRKDWHDFAEYTHWPTFLVQGAQLWKERYSNNQNSEESLKLKSFLTGVFIHQVADAPWHSLVDGYRNHGLVKAFASLEFDNDYQKAHNYIDTMGDFLMLGQVLKGATDNWSYYLGNDWELPDKLDIMELVRRSGLNSIKFWELKACVERGNIALASEVYSIMKRRHEILSVAYEISPRARELMQDHWLGGESNIVAMTNKCLSNFLALFEECKEMGANPEQLLEVCGNLPGVHRTEKRSLKRRVSNDMLLVSPLTPLSLFGSDIAIGRFQKDEVCLAVSAPLEDGEGSVYVIPWRDISGSIDSLSERPVTRFYGARVHSFTFGESDFLVVSASGDNAVHIYHEGLKILTIIDDHNLESHQLTVSSIADVNGDGIPDILLAGPHYGVNETGLVQIVDGRDISLLLLRRQYSKVSLQSLGTISLKAPVSRPFQNYGATVEASSVWKPNSYLYVSCQGLGVVFVYCSKSLHQSILPRYYIINEHVIRQEEDIPLNLKVKPSSAHGMFGKTIRSWNYHDTNYIAISQHLQNKVYIFREQDGFLEFYVTLLLDLSSDAADISSAVGFGHSIDYDEKNDVLYLSSPGFLDGEGAIWKASMTEITTTVETWKLDQLIITLPRNLVTVNRSQKGKGISGFGDALRVGPEGKLIIGSPRFGYGDFDKRQLTGNIAILKLQ